MLWARELAQAKLALARDKAAEELQRKKETDQREERPEDVPQINNTVSPPVGSGGSCAKTVRRVRKKKIKKKAPVTGKRILTRQARGRVAVNK
jgi:hypothetical protein